ncbi:MAG: hypothetical protein RL095_1408 [Verrucomicrobiota bacterium]|jgi:mannitol/fructose-specific phosphotransferase system IIA component (Ntr-type)
MRLIDAMAPGRCLLIQADGRDAALREICTRQDSLLPDAEGFLQSLLEREALMSTGLGDGIAFPHARSRQVQDFFIVAALAPRGIDWDALDRRPVKLIFTIGGPMDRQEQYHALLANLATFLKTPGLKESLLMSENPLDFYSKLNLAAGT